MSLANEALYLRACCNDGGQDGEDGLAAFFHLAVQNLVGIVKFYQTRAAEDNHHQVYILKAVFAVINCRCQMLRGAGTDDVDGIPDGRAGVELRLQLLSNRAVQVGNIQTTLGKGVSKHDRRATSVSNDSAIFPLHFFQREDTRHRRQLLAAKATDDARLTEEGFDGGIGVGNGAGVGRSSAFAGVRAARLDSGDAAAFPNQ